MENNQIIFGRKPVLEALHSGRHIEKLYLDRTLKGEIEKDLRRLAKEADIPISRVPQQNLQKFTRGNHQGVLALAAIVDYKKEGELLIGVQEKNIRRFLILDHITDVRNMGAVMRSAHFFGFSDILLPLKGTAEVNEDAMKSSAGALNHVRLYRTSNLMFTVEKLRALGCKIISLESKGGVTLQDADIALDESYALIIGSEGHGVTREMLKLSDHKVWIEGQGDFDSLNVSVATGIALYALNKMSK